MVDFLEYGAVMSAPEKKCFVDQERSYSLKQIRAAARGIGAAIVNNTDVLNHPVATFLPKSAETLIADLGIFYSGNFYINLDMQTPAERMQLLLENIDPAVILTSSTYKQHLLDYGVADHIIIECDQLLNGHSDAPDVSKLDQRREQILDTDPACIINTSGSTGIPKSAVLSHRSIIDFMLWHQQTYPLDQSDVIGSLSPYHFDGYIVGFYSAVWQGACLNVTPSSLAMFPRRLAEYLRDESITFIFWVPTIMVNMAITDALLDIQLPQLRHVGFAGEVFPVRHLNYWRERIPRADYVNYYGPIEIAIICTHYKVDREFKEEENIPIGYSCNNAGVLILDEDDSPCPAGKQGELCIRGCGLAHGYWKNQEATNHAFVQNPLNLNYPEKIYRTGDIVIKNEQGELSFIGRKDFQIKHQGFRIELGEIENACLTLSKINNASVLYQRNQKQIVLVYEGESPIPPAEIRTELAAILPKYMLPTGFHHIEAMPMNPNGKIDRNALQLIIDGGIAK